MQLNEFQAHSARVASTTEDQAQQLMALMHLDRLITEVNLHVDLKPGQAEAVATRVAQEVARQLAPHWRRMISALGLAGEAGEFADMLKKAYGHGKKLDLDKLAEELGDVQWYVADNATQHGLALNEDVAQPNVDKLSKRYADGFSVAASEARVDQKPPASHLGACARCGGDGPRNPCRCAWG